MQMFKIPITVWKAYEAVVGAYDRLYPWKFIEADSEQVYTGVGPLMRVISVDNDGTATVFFPSTKDGNMCTALTDTPLSVLSGIGAKAGGSGVGFGFHIDFCLDGSGLAFPLGYQHGVAAPVLMPVQSGAVPWQSNGRDAFLASQAFTNWVRPYESPPTSRRHQGYLAAHRPEWKARLAFSATFSGAQPVANENPPVYPDVEFPVYGGLLVIAGATGDGKTSLLRGLFPGTYDWGDIHTLGWSPCLVSDDEPPPVAAQCPLKSIRARDYALNLALDHAKKKKEASSDSEFSPSILLGDDSSTGRFYEFTGALTNQGIPRMFFIDYVAKMSSSVQRFNEMEGVNLVLATLVNLTDIKADSRAPSIEGMVTTTGNRRTIPLHELFQLGATGYIQITSREADRLVFDAYARYANNRRTTQLTSRKKV